MSRIGLIVGTGPGISASFARALKAAGYTVAVASRDIDKLKPLAESIGASPFVVDVSSSESIHQLFRDVVSTLGEPDVVLFNPSARTRGELLSLSAEKVEKDLTTTAVGGFIVAQEAARLMIPKGHGTIMFTGATASVKAFPMSTSFAMGKFAIRALAQSLAKELGPQGIHVVHFVIDGGVRSSPMVPSEEAAQDTATVFTGDNIAYSYMAALNQPKGAWTWEVELRSMNEKF